MIFTLSLILIAFASGNLTAQGLTVGGVPVPTNTMHLIAFIFLIVGLTLVVREIAEKLKVKFPKANKPLRRMKV